MKIAPTHISAQIRRYDPDLRIRWSIQRGCWAIDRKVDSTAILSKPVKWILQGGNQWTYRMLPENSEKFILFRDRYTNILYSHFLDRRLFKALFETDAWKNSYRGKRFFNEADYSEQKNQEREDEKDQDMLEYTGKEALGFMRWRDGERMSMHGNTTRNNPN